MDLNVNHSVPVFFSKWNQIQKSSWFSTQHLSQQFLFPTVVVWSLSKNTSTSQGCSVVRTRTTCDTPTTRVLALMWGGHILSWGYVRGVAHQTQLASFPKGSYCRPICHWTRKRQRDRRPCSTHRWRTTANGPGQRLLLGTDNHIQKPNYPPNKCTHIKKKHICYQIIFHQDDLLVWVKAYSTSPSTATVHKSAAETAVLVKINYCPLST